MDEDDPPNNQENQDRLERLRNKDTPFCLHTSTPNIRKDKASIQRSITEDKQNFLKQVLGENFLITPESW